MKFKGTLKQIDMYLMLVFLWWRQQTLNMYNINYFL